MPVLLRGRARDGPAGDGAHGLLLAPVRQLVIARRRLKCELVHCRSPRAGTPSTAGDGGKAAPPRHSPGGRLPLRPRAVTGKNELTLKRRMKKTIKNNEKKSKSPSSIINIKLHHIDFINLKKKYNTNSPT